MNPESITPEYALEIRIIALLLGELPEAEAAELTARIATEPALQALRDRLAATLGLVREAAQQPLETSGTPVEAMKLSPEKRENLLAAFKTVSLPLAPKRSDWKRYAPLGLAAALVGAIGVGLSGMLLPGLSRAKYKLAAAGQPTADTSLFMGEAPTDPDLGGLSGPHPEGGGYSTNAVGLANVTKSLREGRVQISGQSSEDFVLGISPKPTDFIPAPSWLSSNSRGGDASLARGPVSGSDFLAFQVESDTKGRKAGQMLAEFGRGTVTEQTTPLSGNFDVSGAAAPSGVLLQQRGIEAGQTWQFDGRDLNGRWGEPATTAGVIDNLAAINGPAPSDDGVNAGTRHYFRDAQATDKLTDANGPVGGRGGTVSASTRGFYSQVENPEFVGMLESPKSDAGVPVLGDLPVLGRLYSKELPKEPTTAGVPITAKKPALAVFESQGLSESKAELALNRSQSDLVAPSTFAPSQRFGGFAGGFGGGGSGGSGGGGGGGGGGRLGGATIAGEPGIVPPPDVAVEARFAELDQAEGRASGFGWYLGNTLPGDLPTVAASGVVSGDERVDLFAKADTKQLEDESRFGLKTGAAENESLHFGSTLSAIVPATTPAEDRLVRTSELKEGRSEVALGLASADREPVAGRFKSEEAAISGREKDAPVEVELLARQQVAFAEKVAKAEEPARRLNTAADNGPLRESLLKEAGELKDQQVEYFEAKDGVDEKKRIVAALKLRIEQEKIEQQQPVESLVTIHDRASAGASRDKGLFAKLGDAISGEKSAVARISVEKDKSNVEGLSQDRPADGYDPFFLQTEFEKIASQVVLDRVVDKLGLEEKLAKEQGLERWLSREEARKELKDRIEVKLSDNTGLIEIHSKSADLEEAARIANTVAEVYRDTRLKQRQEIKAEGVEVLERQLTEREAKLAQAQASAALERLKESLEHVDTLRRRIAEEKTKGIRNKDVDWLEKKLSERREELGKVFAPEGIYSAFSATLAKEPDDAVPAKPKAPAPVPQPEVLAAENAFSTFSLNVSDVSFKLVTASLEQGQMPEASSIRAEEFINAFDYRDPAPTAGSPLAFAWDRARSPFEHNRDFLRLSVQTAAAGRSAAQALNLVVLLDNSGSMERADRVRIRREALRVLATQLRPQDRLSVVTFARTARLQADGVSGDQAMAVFGQVEGVTPEGGTNLEEAMGVAYQTAQRHFLANGVNRVVLLTDGAANLGNVDPESLKRTVESNRRQGVALDCFGVGWEGLNDDLLETLSRNGDGRYGFLNSPEEAATGFAQQLAGALQVAASDVKVQVEFNPRRVTTYRQIGYAKHQLTKEQFRDNTVDAAEIGAAEAGNALYTMEVNPQGEGPLATVRVRFKVPGTQDYREHAWEVPFNGAAPALEQAPPAMRLATAAAEFAEWLSDSPFAAEVSPTALRRVLVGVPEFFGANSRAKQLADAVAAAGRLTGK